MVKILLIEDEQGIANFIKQGLEEEGYIIDIADDGTKGLDLALANNYDLLLIDWMLPGITGIVICENFRKKNIVTPIIFLTAKDTVSDTIQGLQVGANDYIKKPFHFEELVARIEVQLRTKNEEHEKLTLGNIQLDISSHQVFKNGKEIQFTQKEFNLLEYLIRNKGKVCTRTDIIQNVWKIYFDYNTSVIDVYINAIRKKLNLQTEEDYIQTVRGIGYIAKD